MKNSKNKYIALFSCFVLAAVFTVGLSVKTNPKTDKNSVKTEETNTAQVSANKNSPAKTQIKVPAAEKNSSDTSKVEPAKTGSSSSESETDTKKENTNITNSGDGYGQSYDEYEEAGEFEDELTFALPVNGETVMDYSSEKLVYDPTLEQYRTNDTICYKTEEGTAVGAAAEGTVESISTDSKNGVSVTLFHGDGWRTTYSQLNSNLAVSEGDIVKKGQTIGFVATPTKYASALGCHLEFKMTLNDNAVDPKTALAE